jgi:S-DNA-T family DNA segregation ATPase FtsK/SpoIIIE
MNRREKSRRQRTKKGGPPSRSREALGLIVVAFGVFVGLSLFSYHPPDWPAGSAQGAILNWGGKAGAFLAFRLIHATFGKLFTWVIPLLIVLWGLRLTRPRWKVIGFRGTVRLVTFGIVASVVLAYVGRQGWVLFPPGASLETAGWVGVFLDSQLVGFLGPTGAGFVLAVVVLVWMILALKLQPSAVILGIFKVISAIVVAVWTVLRWVVTGVGSIFTRKPVSPKAIKPAAQAMPRVETKPAQTAKEIEAEEPRRSQPIITSKPTRLEDAGTVLTPPGVTTATGEYRLPPLDLLNPPTDEGPKIDERQLSRNAQILEEKLADFGVAAKVAEIHPGPVITRYDLEPASGVKVSRIASLADDLALALRAKAIRIIAPLPGMGAVGVEIPNPERVTVSFRSLLETEEFQSHPSRLLFAVGKTTDGESQLGDLGNMPHLLIAGTTGSGKSVFLNSLIMSILFRAGPDEVQFILIDPKKLELSGYSELRNHHLVTRPDLGEDVVTSAENAVQILKSIELEMSRRYDILAEAGSKSIDEYNDQAKSSRGAEAPKPIPYLVVVIDELADLMLLAAKEVEEPIAHLAHLSRAVGIHLVVATQRPSVDVITGVIKANFPCRIAFQVASKIDSRTILDINGAEQLLGRGDMLFIPPGQSTPVRLHAALITQQEVNRVIAHIRLQPVPSVRIRMPAPESADISTDIDLQSDRDNLFDEAARIVARTQQGSVSILQRRLKVGYARAARLIDQLERAGIVGPFDGSKAREVLVEEDYFDNLDRLE